MRKSARKVVPAKELTVKSPAKECKEEVPAKERTEKSLRKSARKMPQ